MLTVRRELWFRACAVVVALLTVWYAAEVPAHAAALRSARERAQRLEDVAQRLGIDADRVRGGERFERDEKSRIERRRAEAVAKLKQLGRGPERAEQATRIAAAIEAAHLPKLLGGVAQSAAQVKAMARRAASARTPEERAAAEHALTAAGHGLERGDREARRSGEPPARLRKALEQTRALASAISSEKKPARPQDLGSLAPPDREGLKLDQRRPHRDEGATPPPPRLRPRLGLELEPELRELYASILDAPGLEVETSLGPADPALLAAGFAPGPLVAVGGSSAELAKILGLAEGALGSPTAGDLAETPETRVTPHLRALVTQLGGDALAIYNYVHDQLDVEPYYGVKKGSVGAFAERAGNDADLSALLVAMLRAAGIPARFEYGTVDLTPAQAMAWTGTTSAEYAADVLYSTGVPATRISDGTKLVAVRVEHVWVRAYVPYTNYRGLPRQGSRAMWVRLDPTLKRMIMRDAVDLRGKVSFDYAGYFARVTAETPLDRLEGQLRSYVAANGLVCKSLDDAIRWRDRIRDELSLLPAEAPAPIVAPLATFASFPASMRHAASVSVGDWSVSLDLPSVYGSALALRYRGASPADESAITAAGGMGRLANPCTVQVVPTLEIDGVEAGRGSVVLPGMDQEVVTQISVPHAAGVLVRHQVTAGSVFAIGFPVGVVPDSLVASMDAKLQAARAAGKTGDDLEVARGNVALWRYFSQLTRAEDRIFAYEWMRVARGVAEGLAGREVASDLLYGTPVSIRPGRFLIDIGHGSIRPYGVDGASARVQQTAMLAGYHGSALEHLVWEQTVSSPAISTTRIFQVAGQQGLRVLDITQADGALVSTLPYSEASLADMTDKVHAGLTLHVPERPVTWGSYQNAEGYVVEDPMTGSADFRLQGTFSGGAANGESTPDGSQPPACTACNANAASTVSLSFGNMFFAETDLTVPARGIPVAFTRRYDSMSPYGGRLGSGWHHTYEVRLVVEPDASITFVNDGLQPVHYAAQVDGSYAPPAGYHDLLQALPQGGYQLVFKDGTRYLFRADGQLSSITDLNAHVVRLEYGPDGLLESVVDATGLAALAFTYEPSGLLASVADASGRAVQFGHVAGDLTSVTDVLGGVHSYSYDANHRLVSKTDKRGGTTYELYDGDGRWIGSQEPDGTGRSASYDFLNHRAVHHDKTGALTIYEYNERGNPTAITDALGNRRSIEWDGEYNKLSETDARGNVTRMTYDSSGNVLARTDASGATTTYGYDDRGRVETVTDAAGQVTTNTYDTAGNLQTTTDASGAVTRYAYSSDGLPQSITQPGAATTQLEYDAQGKVTGITDATGGRTVLGYDGFGHLSTIQDALGNARTLTADAAGRIESMADASGNTTRFEYDAQGNRTAVVDAAGARTEFTYDVLNRLSTVKDAQGHVTQTEYDPEGRVTARIDALGARTRYEYDVAGRLAETHDPLGQVTTQGYCADAGGQPCAVVDPLGNATQVELDALGRPVATVDANGTRTVQHYDTLGRRDWSEDGAGRRTTSGYDAAGRLLTVTDPLGSVTTYGYDARGNRTSVKDANGHVTSFAYDLANRLRSETNPLGITTSYEYDAAGNRRFKTDGNGFTTEYRYDANRRITAVLFTDGTSYEFAYDARGNRTVERSPTQFREMAYDELGRASQVVDHALGRTIEYGYDAAGNRASMKLDTGELTQYHWDPLGRLAELVDVDGQATRFRYDAAGRRSRVDYGNGTSATYSHDGAGQVLSIVYGNPAGEVLSAFAYGYDSAGNRQYKAFADGTKEQYGYDALNRLTSASYPGGRHVDYGYDAAGNRLSMADTNGAATRWAATATASSQYGGAGPSLAVGAPDANAGCSSNNSSWWPWYVSSGSTAQWLQVGYARAERARGLRVRETVAGGFVTRVDLIDDKGATHTVHEGGDGTACGGWLQVSFPLTAYKVAQAKVYTAASGPIAIDAVGLDVVPTQAYEYNVFNQLTAITGSDGGTTTFGYDNNGNQIRKTEAPAGGTAQLTQYVYNQDNRLVGIALPNGGSNAFEYDANGLRTKKTDSSGTTSYLLDGLSVIAQYAPDGAKQAWYTQSLAHIDEVLSVVNGQGKYWYQADALGSTYALADGSGNVAARGGYDVFGVAVAVSGNVGQPFGFTGREHDLDSGLVYARARYLNVATGRWDRADPIGQIGGPDYYLYVGSNPITHSDPSGLMFATTMDAYAVLYPIAFLFLLADLGYTISIPRNTGTTSYFDSRNRIARQISTRGRPQPQPFPPSLGPDVFCQPTPEREDPWVIYYRGLSTRDLGEFQLFQVVLSNYQRDGRGSIADGLIEALDPETPARHILSGSAGSPLVSVTTDLDVARRFANSGPKASGVVIKFETRRLPMYGGLMQDSELLFFWQLGFDGERLSIYN